MKQIRIIAVFLAIFSFAVVSCEKAPAPTTLSVDPSSLFFSSEPMSAVVTVTTNSAKWNAVSDNDWISIVPSNGDNTFLVQVEENSAENGKAAPSRSGYIAVTAGDKLIYIQVMQAAEPEVFMVLGDTEPAWFPEEGGILRIKVAENVEYKVSGLNQWVQLKEVIWDGGDVVKALQKDYFWFKICENTYPYPRQSVLFFQNTKGETFTVTISQLARETPYYQADNLKQALEILENNNMVTDIQPYQYDETEYDGADAFKEVYQFSFIQPLDHFSDVGDYIYQRVIASYTGDPNAPTVIYTGGYALSEADVDEKGKHGTQEACDLAKHLKANYINVEYRYFRESVPQRKYPDPEWTYFNSEQMSNDLHQIYLWLRPFFKGTWASTGCSKGGITSALYSYFFPNDMDLYMPFCAPFFTSLEDERMGNFYYGGVASPELREQMNESIAMALRNREKYYKFMIYHKQYDNIPEEQRPAYVETIKKYYNNLVLGMFHNYLAYHDFKSWVNLIPKEGDSPASFMQFVYGADYTGPKAENGELVKNALRTRIGKVEKDRMRFIFKPDQGPKLSLDDPYQVQAHMELGYYMFSRNWIGTYGDNTVTEDDLLNPIGTEYEIEHLDFNPALMNGFLSSLSSTKANLLFIYGENDPWTGGCVTDDHIAGNSSVVRFLLPNYNHRDYFLDVPDAGTICRVIDKFMIQE